MGDDEFNQETKGGLDEEYQEQQERKKRHRYIAIIFAAVILAGSLLFFDNMLNYFTSDKPKSMGRVDTEGARISRVTEDQWQAYALTVKGLLENGKVDEALKILLGILNKDPGIAEAHYLAGTALLRQGRVQGAYDQFKQASALRADYYEADEKLGEIYLLAGDYKAARDISSKLAKGREYLQDGLLLEAEIAMAEGSLDQALQKASTALTGAKAAMKPKLATYLAELYHKKGNKDEADKIIDKLDPASMDAMSLLSVIRYHLGAGNEGKALALFKRILAHYPDSAEVNYRYAQYLFKKNRFQEAGDYYKKAMSSMPDAMIIGYHLTECYMATGHHAEAKSQIEILSRKFPDSILVAGLTFYYHLLVGEGPQAIDALQRLTVLLPYAPRPYVMLAALYWQEGNVSLAEVNVCKAIKLGERTVFPFMLMGDILFSKKDFKQALSYYDRVLAVEPDNVIALLQRGDLYLRQGQAKRAEEQYRKALSLNPRIKSIQTKIAWARAQCGDMEAALAMNERYLKDMPNDSQAVTAYANTLIAAKRLDDALNTVQSAIKRKPQAWELHYLLGDLFTLKNDFKNASSSYERALELNASDINMVLNIGARYESNALDADTEKYYLKILKKLPNNMMVENQLAWFYIERLERPQKAKELIESLMAEKDWPEMKDTIAWYYYKLGNFTDAEHYFREALKLAPDRSESRARLALTLYSLNRNREAVSEAEKAVAQLTPGPLKNSLQEAMTRSGK